MSLLVTCIEKINLCYFFCVDLEKAIDSVDTLFLRAFGFGPDTCQWISTFYKDIKSSVSVNGQLSQ